MRWFIVLATLTIVVVLIAAICSMAFKAVEISREIQARPLINMDRQYVSSISLQLKNDPEILLVSNGHDSWQLQKPMHGPANIQNTLLVRESLFDMQVQSVVDPQGESRPTDEQIGIGQPRAVVELADITGQKTKIQILNFIPRRKESYVKIAGDETIYCVSPDPMNTIQLSIDELRSKKLIELSQAELMMIQSVEAMGQSEFMLKRTDTNNWTISGAKYGNKPYPARSEAVKSMLDSIAAIEILAVNSEPITDLERFGFGDPWQSFKIKFEPLAGRPDIDIAISAHSGTMFASLDKQLWLVQLRSDSGRDVIREFWSMVQRNIFNFATDEVVSLLISDGTYTTRYLRDSAGWQSSAGLADSDKLNQAVRKLSDLQFESVIDSYMRLSGFGLDKPANTITLNLADGKSLSLLTGSKSPAAGRIYVKTRTEDSVYTVNGAIIEQVLARAPVITGTYDTEKPEQSTSDKPQQPKSDETEAQAETKKDISELKNIPTNTYTDNSDNE